MKSIWKVLAGTLALTLVAAGLVWAASYQAPQASPATARNAGGAAMLGISDKLNYTVTASDPVTPTISIAVRDLPVKPDLPELDREPLQRDDHGFIGPDINMPPHGNVLAELQAGAPEPIPDDFTTPIVNFEGVQSSSSPPDDTGDVGLNHFLQGDNGPNGSRVTVFDKTGVQLAQFDMEDLATSAPCNSGYCDPIIQYDEMADRWMIAEFDSSANTLCVYISTTPDPLGTWYAYGFNPPASGFEDYPKYGVWPDGYYIGVNNGGDVIVLERADMLNGLPATLQSFVIDLLPGFGFQLPVPATLEGQAPPAGSPGFLMRPRDTEIHGGTCPDCDLLEMWAFHVDWVTPANSSLTELPGVQLTDWDQTLCGTGSDWSCMSQPGTAQKLDPIREPIHFPLQYRNFDSYETLVGCFAEDVDGLDRAASHWFELRRTPAGFGDWTVYQEGVVGDGVNDVHRAVCSAAMDSAGNIAMGYTRTGGNVPDYPSIYYSGRRASDPLGTMPYYDNLIWNGVNSNTDNERWGDYSGIGIDPADGCTFWYTTEYGGNGQTRIASFKFDECGTPDFTLSVNPDAQTVCVGEDAMYSVNIGSVSEFSNTVTLTSTGVPAGATESFMPNPLTPPGESVFTIGNTIAAAPGSYNVTVGGSADGSAGHQDTVAFNLVGSAPQVPALLLPVDGSLDQSTQPVFDWSDVPDATAYTIQIASDPDFSDIVDQASGLSASTYTPSAFLTMDTVYYWRVFADNVCGGTPSATGAFRTAFSSCTTYPSTDVPKAIYNTSWSTSVVNIPDAYSLTDVDVILDSVAHPYDADLDIFIKHPDGTEVELSTDNGSYGDNYTGTRFDDEASTPITGGTAPFTGSYIPEESLEALDAKTSDGTWTLRIYDDASPNTGTLYGWSLVLCAPGGGVTGDYSDLDTSYGVAWHTGDGDLRLGTNWTLDSAFAPAGFDDLSDDGVGFPEGLTPGQPNLVRVNVQGTPANGMWLRLWFDWNADGVFDGEQVYNGALTLGDNDLTVNVPGDAVLPLTFRARLYDAAGEPLRDLGSWGEAVGGEVEDGQTTSECVAGLEVTPPTDALSGEPGSTVTYAVSVTNSGSCQDTYDVSVSGNAWTTGAPLKAGPLAAGASTSFDVTVDIPAEALPGDSDQAQITVASQSNPAMQDDSLLTTTVVGIAPEATFASNTPVTVGELASFTPTVAGTGPFEYLWDFGDGVTSTLEAPTHLYAATGTYTVTLTVTSEWGSDTYTAEFVVIPAPPVTFTFLALVIK
jgi:subtilisin-like proprotein convertase family protein